jgi:hypothetical protein
MIDLTTSENYRAYRTMAAEKADWGRGDWTEEPDKAQCIDAETGLDCLIVRNRVGALCGYVGVPDSHPWHGKGYHDVDVRVHGGLTFANRCADASEAARERMRSRVQSCASEAATYPQGDAATFIATWGDAVESSEAFGCAMEAHAICHVPAPGRPEHVWWFGFDCAHSGDLSPGMDHRWRYSDEEGYRAWNYVVHEVRRLAKQILTMREEEA